MTVRKAVAIPIQPWFRDHAVSGQAIFPAVESMLLLAEVAREIVPGIAVTSMADAVFSRTLPIPQQGNELPVLVEYEEERQDSRLQLKLLSKLQFKKMSRVIEHARITFGAAPGENIVAEPSKPTDSPLIIEAERIYGELVPFGPSYRSLVGPLLLWEGYALGTLRVPPAVRPQAMEKEMGSPFPLDGAMHAACVLGQCTAGFVPFPVAFGRRDILQPTRAGEQYTATVTLVSCDAEEIRCDLALYDGKGNLCETVQDLQMRDISRGTLTPPRDLPRLRVSPPSPG